MSHGWYAALFPSVKWAKETGLELVTTLGGIQSWDTAMKSGPDLKDILAPRRLGRARTVALRVG